MQVKILGSGTSTGVPVIGCQCHVCNSNDSRDSRTRSSIAFRASDDKDWVIVDTGPDLRAQILSAGIQKIAGVLYTHTHSDHSSGFDDLRAFSFDGITQIPCYLFPEYISDMRVRFAYAFQDTGYRGVTPSVELIPIESTMLNAFGLDVETMRLPHGSVETCGFRVGKFAYVTDFKRFSSDQIRRWKGKIHTMIASGIHFGRHDSHSVIPETIQLFKDLDVKRGIITHISHRVSHQRDSQRLPEFVEFAYDGMEVDV